MSGHPTREMLAEFAWGEPEAVAAEAHVAECAECALYVERCRAEARRIAGALETAVPDGLAGRILATPMEEPRRRFAPLAGVAAALLLAAAGAWAWHERSQALRRIDDLERRLAAAPKPGVAVPPVKGDDIDTLLDSLCKVEVERNIADLIAWAELPENAAGPLRATLLAASETTSEALDRASRGEIDFEQLAATDTLPGLDADLMAALGEEDCKTVQERLHRASHDAAERLARSFSGDLQASAGLDASQAGSLEAYLIDKCAWRRDLPFFPEVARRALVASLIGNKDALRAEVRAVLNDQQAARVLVFLQREEAARKRMWEDLRKG